MTSDLRAALAAWRARAPGTDARRHDARVRADDGRAARGTSVAGAAQPGGERSDARQHLRQPDAVRRPDRPRRSTRGRSTTTSRLLRSRRRPTSCFCRAKPICTRTAIAIASPRTELSTVLEGAHRPGHFDGVLTVVLKLLQIASAERAYFGEKDWQQLHARPRDGRGVLPADRHRRVPTVREADGLALSSRNRRLPPHDRAEGAAVLSGAVVGADRQTQARRDAARRRASPWTTSRIGTGAGSERCGSAACGSSTTCRSETADDSHARRRQQPDLRRRVRRTAR